MTSKPAASGLLKVTAALIEAQGKVLIARRRPGGPFGGLWEFPGGKLEPDESPERGLERELAEELGVEARVEDFLGSFPYRGPALAVELMVYRTFLLGGKIRLTDHDEVRWVDAASLDESAFAEPDRPVVGWLRAHLKNSSAREG